MAQHGWSSDSEFRAQRFDGTSRERIGWVALALVLTTSLTANAAFEKRVAAPPPEQVRSFEKEEKVALVDEKATRGVVNRALHQMNGLPRSPEGTVNYLATYETTADDIERTGLALREVERVLAETGARRQVVLIDARRENAKRGAASRSFSALSESEGLAALMSTRAGGFSYEDDRLQHGSFTHGEHRGDFLLGRVEVDTASNPPIPPGGVTGPGTPPAGTVTGATALPAGLRWDGIKIVREADGAEMKKIPAGTFSMGSPRYWEFRPVRRVGITQEFLIDRHEVTVGQYREVMGLQPNRQIGGLDTPVVRVSWNDAKAYCEKVGGRLPTEAEWEYAARGGLEGKAYPWGDEAPVKSGSARANLDGKKDGFEKTSPVCSFEANGYGLCDMAGNVWEWVSDWLLPYPSGDVTDPKGPSSGQYRVIRGGSWEINGSFLDVANRAGFGPRIHRNGDIGFRCARDFR